MGGDRETSTGKGFREVRMQDTYTRPDLQKVVMGTSDSLTWRAPSYSLT